MYDHRWPRSPAPPSAGRRLIGPLTFFLIGIFGGALLLQYSGASRWQVVNSVSKWFQHEVLGRSQLEDVPPPNP